MRKKQIISMIMSLLLFFSFITVLTPDVSAADYEYAMFPAGTLDVSQIAYGAYSHSEKNVTDICPHGDVKAPFSGTIVYRDTTWGYVVLQSNNMVRWADGTLDYMSVGFMHDNDISDLPMGKTISQGTAFYQAGTKSPRNNITGAHVHIVVMKGKLKNGRSNYYSGDKYIFEAFYLSSNVTIKRAGSASALSNTGKQVGAPMNYSSYWKTLGASCTLTFNANGGSVTPSTKSVTKGGTCSLPTPIRAGYTFAGWYNGSTPIYNSTTINSNMTLTAHWTAIPSTSSSTTKYTFYFNSNGGSGSMSSFTATYGNNFTIPANAYSRAGYTFQGWNVKRNGDSKWYVNGKGWLTDTQIKNGGYSKALYSNQATKKFDSSWTNGYSKNSTYTFYAVWKATPVSISGTSGGIPSGNLTYGKSFGLRGVISSGSKITKVEAYIYNSSGGVVRSYSATPNKTSYNIRYDGLNSSTQFKFGTLAKNTKSNPNYRYVVYVTNAAGRQPVIDSTFKIV